MKKQVATVVLIFITSLLESQECWLQPTKFRYRLGEEMSVNFLVGENFDGDTWRLKTNTIEKLDWFSFSKTVDLRSQVKPDNKEKLKYKFAAEGTYCLALQSNSTSTQWSAEKFNTYLKDEGLDNVIERTKNNINKPTKERCVRYAKLLVQCGTKTDDTYKKKTGFRVEIVPLQNPYTLKSGDHLQCLVLFNGKPNPHQLVKLWSKIGTTTFLQNAYTEDDGTLKFPISNKGPWMVSTVKMIASEQPDADWQSFWASLVFGIE